ncbi:MAG: glycosyl hydrolase, partial [Anaerolineae bacterium]|nr:glycosyl hydrolase [Anaerolineae bacterium]
RSHVRDDGRTYHVVRVDPYTGLVEGPQGGQGLTPQSCWSRGQAWALYGFTMMARDTGDAHYLDTARLIADCWIDHMAGQQVPPWDFDAPVFLHPVPRDTSAGAIAAAGLLDLAKIIGTNGAIYRDHALALLTALSQDYLNPPEQPGILREGCSNLPQGQSRQALIYGDYYFVEALTRVRRPAVAMRILGY